jgi:hypothetical protein
MLSLLTWAVNVVIAFVVAFNPPPNCPKIIPYLSFFIAILNFARIIEAIIKIIKKTNK